MLMFPSNINSIFQHGNTSYVIKNILYRNESMCSSITSSKLLPKFCILKSAEHFTPAATASDYIFMTFSSFWFRRGCCLKNWLGHLRLLSQHCTQLNNSVRSPWHEHSPGTVEHRKVSKLSILQLQQKQSNETTI